MPWEEPVKLSPPFNRPPTPGLGARIREAVKRDYAEMAEAERLVRAFLEFKNLVKKMAKRYDEMTEDEKWECRGYQTFSPCDVCGAEPAKIDPRFFFVICRDHMDLTPFQVSEAVRAQGKENR